MRLPSLVSSNHFSVEPLSATLSATQRKADASRRRKLEPVAQRPREIGQLPRLRQSPVKAVEHLAHTVGRLVREQRRELVASQVVAAHGRRLMTVGFDARTAGTSVT